MASRIQEGLPAALLDSRSGLAVDLSPFAGRAIGLRLENAPNDWSYEFAYWSDVKVNTTP